MTHWTEARAGRLLDGREWNEMPKEAKSVDREGDVGWIEFDTQPGLAATSVKMRGIGNRK